MLYKLVVIQALSSVSLSYIYFNVSPHSAMISWTNTRQVGGKGWTGRESKLHTG